MGAGVAGKPAFAALAYTHMRAEIVHRPPIRVNPFLETGSSGGITVLDIVQDVGLDERWVVGKKSVQNKSQKIDAQRRGIGIY